jgi:hypothetical protein
MPRLFLLFNHTLTAEQEADARNSLGVTEIVTPPPAIRGLWGQLPSDTQELAPLLAPVGEWLAAEARPGDHVLIQGDFGAVYLIVNITLAGGLIPVYSTTEREAMEEHLPDGTVRLTHRFRHRRFRRYGQ